MDIKCPNCGMEYEIDNSEYGRFFKCETCGKGFVAGTSAAKKIAVNDAAKNLVNSIYGVRAVAGAVRIAVNATCERVKSIDWRKQRDHVMRQGRRLFNMIINTCRKRNVTKLDSISHAELTTLCVLCVAGIFLFICITPSCLSKEGFKREVHYESDAIAYSLPSVNEMKCPIEKGHIRSDDEAFDNLMPYNLTIAIMYSLKGKEAPIEGVAYKHEKESYGVALIPRVCRVFKHGVLVEVKGYRAFVLTDRCYSLYDELAEGYYIYGGNAICNDGYSSVRKSIFRAFREMDGMAVKKRGLD